MYFHYKIRTLEKATLIRYTCEDMHGICMRAVWGNISLQLFHSVHFIFPLYLTMEALYIFIKAS